MKNYLVQFKWMKPYPKESSLRTTATNMATAIARAVRIWKKQEGRGVKHLTITVSTI